MNNNISPYIKLYRLFDRSEKVKIIILFVMMVVGSLLEVTGIGVIPAFASVISNPDGLMDYPFIENILNNFGITTSEQLLIFGAVALIMIFVVKNLYLSFFFYIKSTFLRNRQVRIATRLFDSYMHAPYTFHIGRNTSELLRNIKEVNRIVKQVLINALKLIMDILLVLFIFTLLIVVEPIISIAVIVFLGLATVGFLSVIQRKIKNYGKQEQQERRNFIQAVNQGLGGVKVTMIMGREKYFNNIFHRSASRKAQAARYKEITTQINKPVIETIVVSGLLIIALILVLQGREVQTIIPLLVLFGAASIRLMPAFKDIASSWTNLRYAIVSVNPVYDDLEKLNGRIRNTNAQIKFTNRLSLKDIIEVKDVYYRYPDSAEQALKGINLEIKSGSAVALVGFSGVGKTTLADILLGLLEPQQGSVIVDGMDIRTNLKGWQKNIGYIPQFIYLSDDTIRRNIAWGIEDAEIDNDKLNIAIDTSQLNGLIENLPQGINTAIGEGGVRLSGGQRQRIGIARALYHNPEVLIMDEATSALDNITEKYIINAVERLKGKRTVVMIAHRLTTVEKCDIIYFMKNGTIVDKGSYKELLRNNEEFQKIALLNV